MKATACHAMATAPGGESPPRMGVSLSKAITAFRQLRTAAAAFRMTSMTTFGWDSIGTRLLSTSVTVAVHPRGDPALKIGVDRYGPAWPVHTSSASTSTLRRSLHATEPRTQRLD
jgi:hypothetical protein